ncbi:DUF3558 domain-containing protein [Prescottella defluvii]|nr:DUF3558 domain-containing protein [Prescottella defluvii]
MTRIPASVVRSAAVLAPALVLAGCTSIVSGTPTPVGAGESGASSRFASLLTECDVVAPDRIAEAVGGGPVERGFFGAICRWTVGGPSGPVRVTFNWFETGSLDIERRTSEQLGYDVQDVSIEGRRAVLSRPPQDPGSCGISAGGPAGGVVGWWVQFRAAGHPDPCDAAIELAKLTLTQSA